MDLRHLRYFVAVAEELNFSRAAERLHIAQPPLSIQIRQLEEELGVTLLQRTRRRVELTDSGKIYLEQARQILRSIKEATVKAQRAQRGEIGQLAVGFFEHMSYTMLPPILRAYRERFPNVDVQLRWYPVVELVDALLRGDIDISFMRPVSGAEELRGETLLKEPFVLATPSDHPFAQSDSVQLTDCASENFVIYSNKIAPDFHRLIMSTCASAGFVPRIVTEAAQVYTLLGLVSSGAGIAFVPASVRRVQFEHVDYVSLSDTDAEIEVQLAWTRTPSSLMRAFISTAKDVVRNISTHTLSAS